MPIPSIRLAGESVRAARSALAGAQPGDVRGRGRHAGDPVADRRRYRGRPALGLRLRHYAHPAVHRAVRQRRRGTGGGAGPGAGRQPALHPRAARCPAHQGGRRRAGARHGTAPGRPGAGAGRRTDPADGEIVEGAASINESAVTGESAPVLREAGTDNSGVTAGTKLLSDSIVVEVTVESGQSLLDRMIALVESAKRQKTPNEIALTVLLAALTIVFLIVVATLVPFAAFVGSETSVPVLVALLVCLIPTTIGGLLPAIGIAGMDRAMRANLVAKSGKAVEVAGNIDTLLLDKTGTITHGDRQATDFLPLANVAPERLRDAALLASLADPTPEGKSIVALARKRGAEAKPTAEARFLPFSAKTRLSGIDQPDGRRIRKGAPDAIRRFVTENGGTYPDETTALVERVARGGATPLVVAEDDRVLGVVPLSDIIKTGIKERFQRLHAMGVRTVMITGDNPLTAAAIAAEAGVDDYIAEATPEDKLEYIRREQARGTAGGHDG